MSTFEQIKVLVRQRNVLVSQHAYASLTRREILFRDVLSGVADGEVIEDYPHYHIGPAVLVLQKSEQHELIHVVWGIEKNTDEPAVLVTAYRPNPTEWTDDLRRRRI